MADASYQPKVYKTQGGAELVVTSSGTLTLEGRVDMVSGSSMTVASGAGISLASGSSFSCATDLEIASGGSISMAAGSAFKLPVQTAATTATTITPTGITLVAGTTVGPTFLISNPVTGGLKILSLTGTTAGTLRAIIAAATTAVTFTSSGNITLTMQRTGVNHIALVGISTAAYRPIGLFSSTMAGFST